MKQNDVIVIGGGIAGLFAAITAARRGKQVLLMTKGVGALAIAGGTVDIYGYDASGAPVRDPAAALAALAPEHPYSRIGQEKVRQAMQAFLALCAGEGYPYKGVLEQNQWIPTALGRLKPTCFVPMTMDASRLKVAGDVHVIGFEGLKDYSPQVIAHGLSQYSGYRKNYTATCLKTDLENGRDLTALDVARWLETPSGLKSCIDQITQAVSPNSLILLPPVLGTRPDYTIFDQIEQATRCQVVETIGLPPAVTGFRLRRLLLGCLRKWNVRMIEQTNIIGSTVEQGRCTEIVTRNLDRERSYQAQSIILATGGFLGGGLAAEPGRVRETVFGLPVPAPTEQTEWSRHHLFFAGVQPFAKFGVRTDGRLRPVDATGNVLLNNVFVAGKTLAGYDYCTEKSGNGVALATAFQAGLEA
jgi:glycerol-3-phosphate dehydrogenase subunit B